MRAGRGQVCHQERSPRIEPPRAQGYVRDTGEPTPCESANVDRLQGDLDLNHLPLVVELVHLLPGQLVLDTGDGDFGAGLPPHLLQQVCDPLLESMKSIRGDGVGRLARIGSALSPSLFDGLLVVSHARVLGSDGNVVAACHRAQAQLSRYSVIPSLHSAKSWMAVLSTQSLTSPSARSASSSASSGGISDNSSSLGEPSIAVVPDDRPCVAWDDRSSRETEIYVRRWIE